MSGEAAISGDPACRPRAQAHCGLQLLRFLRPRGLSIDDEMIEALDELITLGQVPPAPGDIEKVLPQLGISRLACAPFRIDGPHDALGDVIAQLVQHGAPTRLRADFQ